MSAKRSLLFKAMYNDVHCVSFLLLFFFSQIRSPGESIVVEIDALDELMHNTSAFLQIRVWNFYILV